MAKGIIAALVLGVAAPSFAQSPGKDVGDAARDASDSAQDAFHTDSGSPPLLRAPVLPFPLPCK